jgi:hypothetical protein
VLPIAALVRLQPDLRGSRSLYLASAFACLALAQLFGAALGARRPTAAGLRSAIAALALLVAAGASAWSTARVVARWRDAGRLARRVVATFPACERADGPVFVGGLPAHARGAYVFQNAFHHALALDRGCDVELRYGPPPSPAAEGWWWSAAEERWVPAEP